MRIAHLSDLHFVSRSFSLSSFFSKKCLGIANLLWNRGGVYCTKKILSLPDLFHSLEIDCVLISGDCTTLADPKEYAFVAAFVSLLRDRGLTTFLIPGNHDHYTKKAEKERYFYLHLPNTREPFLPAFSLEEQGVCAYLLEEKWILVALDTAIATPFYSSNGLFSHCVETHLKKLLAILPPDAKVMILNHFPFFPIGRPRRHLIRGEKLQKILETDDRVQFYLHGHTHLQSVADLREEHLPIVLDSGSASFYRGSWNFLELHKDDSSRLSFYRWEGTKWKVSYKKNFSPIRSRTI